MIYIAIDEKKPNGEALLNFLKGIDEKHDFVEVMDEEDEVLERAIIDAMQTPRVKSGNSLREIIF
jgi:hypothetical protein